MEAIRQTQKKYCSRAMATAIFIAIFLILMGYKPMGKGLVLGAIFSVINFILMGQTLPLKMGLSKKRRGALGFFSIIGRYALLAVPLITAIRYEQFHLVTAVVGIFSVQLVIILDHMVKALTSMQAKQT